MAPDRLLRSIPARTAAYLVLMVAILNMALVGISVGLYIKSSRLETRVDAQQAKLVAAATAADTSKVAACFQSANAAPDVARLLGLLDALASSSIQSNQEAITQDPDAALNDVRRASLERLIPQRDAARRFTFRVIEETPTRQDCQRLATRLGVDASKVQPPTAGT